MAVYPPPPAGPPQRGVRSSTVLQRGQQAYNSTGKLPPQIGTSKPQFTPRQTRVTAEDLKDPARLAKIIRDLQAALEQATAASRSNVLGSPCIVRNVSMSNGVPVVIPHTLGRPWTGLWCVRQGIIAPPFIYETAAAVTYPIGLGTDKVAVIIPGGGLGWGAGPYLYDLAITGD